MTVLRKHALWLIIATLAGIAGAWIVYTSRPALYLSTAQVDVEANGALHTAAVTPNMATEQQVATSGVVLAGTAHTLHMTARTLAPHLSANVTGTANIVTIGCAMPTPIRAHHCAAAAAAAYVAFRNLTAASKGRRAVDLLRVTLVTPATLPVAKHGLRKKILLPLGALLGLLAGVGAIFVRDRFDDRVRDRADLERFLEARVVAGIPHLRRRDVDPAFVFTRAPLSSAADAYRYLCSSLKPFVASDPDGETVLVAGAQAGEGRTCVAANLAAALARAGTLVIMVDAHLRHPSLSGIFGAADRPGLTDLLAGSASLDEVLVPTDVRGLRLVPVGQVVDRAVDMFEGPRLARAFAEMKTAAGVVVVDSAPMLTASDAIALVRVSNLVVMVADARRTGRGSVAAAAEEIRALRPQPIVGVLNNEPPRRSGQAWSSVTRRQELLAAEHGVSATPAGVAPVSSPNGQERVQLDTVSTGAQNPARPAPGGRSRPSTRRPASPPDAGKHGDKDALGSGEADRPG